jgi:hypothetical protein
LSSSFLPRGRTAAAALAFAFALTGCSGDSAPDTKAAPTPCETPGEDLTATVPDEFAIDEVASITHVRERRRFIGIEAVTDTSIVELYPVLARSLLDSGFQILSGDNEGFEAEIFFARGDKATGTYILVEGPCEGLVTIRLLVNETSGAGTS